MDSKNCKTKYSNRAARRTGLSPSVLRTRIGAVRPARSPAGQRFSSDADIGRLRLISRALEAGRRIGQVADLTTEELGRLVTGDRRAIWLSDGSALRPELKQIGASPKSNGAGHG